MVSKWGVEFDELPLKSDFENETLSNRQMESMIRAINDKVSVYDYVFRSPREREFYENVWNEAEAHEKKYGFWPCFELPEIDWDDPRLDIYQTPVEDWKRNKMENDKNRLQKAAQYATEKHFGQVRKGTIIPYIVHPMEVLSILQRMDADTDLLIAGLLHDVVEDAKVSPEELRAEFGDDVAELVLAHTEDKSLSWEERKSISNEQLKTASKEVRMLILADKLSNLRSIASDVYLHGDTEEYWEKFNRRKEAQSKTYSDAIDALDGMQDEPETAWAYWELNALYKDVFVSFGYDDEHGILYQKACHEDVFHMLRFNAPFWTTVTECLPGTIYEVARGFAERMEDNWMENTLIHGENPVQ